jgi:hypothetical protein
LLVLASAAGAHGFVGDRFFPPTVATDDPFATDELELPAISLFTDSAAEGSPKTQTVATGFEFDKEIFPHFAIGISDDYLVQKPAGLPTITGWDNLSLSAKWQFWQSDEHEAVLAVGAEADVGGSGSRATGDSASVITPTVYFGKGFGDLPDSLDALKPLAITGTIGEEFPLSGADPNVLDVGLAFEYSLPYLQQHVRDVGLPHPLADIIPVVEFTFSDPENRGQSGQVVATVSPGILWETHYFQLGAEANIPLNSRSGVRVGATLSLQIYIDDLFPKIFGHPVFGKD